MLDNMTGNELRIAARYCGPPESGNGGYSAGLLAGKLGASVEVTLRKPPPLERLLQVEIGDERASLKSGTELIAEARTAELQLALPAPPSFEEARAATARYVGHQRHHFPGCFVCGPARAEGDGLRIFPGEIAPGTVAASWIPHPSVGDATSVRPEVLWAALDCVGYFAAAAPDYPVALLGRISAALMGGVAVGERCVVLGFVIERVGRKLHAGTALFGADGALRGHARQTWITLA
jgi:hypothetical protein